MKAAIRIGLLVLFIAGSGEATLAQQKPPQAPQQGRYQIFQGNEKPGTFLLDTWTGSVWMLAQVSDVKGEPPIWHYMDRLDNAQQVLDWSRRKRPIKTEGGEGK